MANELDRDMAAQRPGQAPAEPEQPPVEPQPAQPEPSAEPPATPPPAPVSGELSTAPVQQNGWDEMDFSAPIAYHDDGPIGSAVRFMGQDSRMDVDGQPLANVLGVVATDVVQGRRSPQEGVDAYKEVRDRLPEGSQARAQLDYAIGKIDAPAGPAPSVPASTPEPLRKLVNDLHAVPLVRREPDKEMRPLLDAVQRFQNGEISRFGLADQLSDLTNHRHEMYGDSGKFTIDRAVQEAVTALRPKRR
jgi:hypothetical protein